MEPIDHTYRESTLDEMIAEVFSSSPKAVNSIQLQTDGLELKELFAMMLEIFTKGMKIMFSDHEGRVNLETISAEQFMEVKQRFRSFGIEIYYEIKPYFAPGDVTDVFDEDVDEDNLPDLDAAEEDSVRDRNLDALPETEEDKLSDFFYTIHCANADYKIWFDLVSL